MKQNEYKTEVGILSRPLSAVEYDQIVHEWNATQRPYREDKTISELFEEQVDRTPSNIALVYEGEQLSYAQLNARSNQLARRIRDKYADRCGRSLEGDTLIALYLDRGIEMVVGILGVLKAGGAYVPIDPGYPQERVGYMLEDTATELVLTQRGLGESKGIVLPAEKVLHIDLSEEIYKEEEETNLAPYSQSTDLAYVIYTSGTTGKPKGVMIEHHSVINTLQGLIDVYDVSVIKKVTAYTSYVFDVSISEIFASLIQGLEVHVLSNSVRLDYYLLSNYLAKNKIDLAYIPPSILGFLHPNLIENLKVLVYAGEPCSKQAARTWSKNVRLYNLYGPTELTIYATCKKIDFDEVGQIGKPFQNIKAYVLDSCLNPVPIGVVGELYFSGAGIARGYLNNSAMTQERFILNPFVSERGKISGCGNMYRTGDLAKWLPDGNLEFIGRNDNQVKIRGFRVELGEIEHHLSKIKGIKQSCVVVKERETHSGLNKYLVGYYLLDGRIEQQNDNDIVYSWEKIYDLAVYTKEIAEDSIEADFSGWISYITGEPIPISEMRDWRDNILTIIRNLMPKNVLEIGVGSGLLMYPLLREVQLYVGLDISNHVIDRHKKYLSNLGHNVELYHLKADQIDQLLKYTSYDTIIINSVILHFPSIKYFEHVFEMALSILSNSGFMFLGDIRNFDLHADIIEEKLKYKHQNFTKKDIELIAMRDNDLLISPQYFIGLKNKYRNIDVRVLERNGSYNNELSRFRYDVIISKHEGNSVSLESHSADDNFNLSADGNYPLYNTPYFNQLGPADILQQLSSVLPEYMVPGALVQVETFPLTVNGKLDRQALPEPDLSLSSLEYVAPVTQTEVAISKIWQDVLGLDRIGMTDDFFRIGGNSISAIRVSHRMSKLLGREIRVADIFSGKTISGILGYNIGEAEIRIVKGAGDGSGVLSFAQERLWFIEEYEGGSNAYHIPMLYELGEGSDVEGIRYALVEVVKRHEVLRSTLERGEDRESGVQVVHDQVLEIEEVELSEQEDYASQIREDINRPFDLRKSYPLRVKLYHIEQSEGKPRRVLLINLHHIAGDGWSIDILQRELFAYYEAYVKGIRDFSFGQLEIQYKDYAMWQRTYLTGEVLGGQLRYWKERLSGYQTLELPTDYIRPVKIDYRGSSEEFVLSASLSDRLRSLAHRYGVTLHSVMLSSINILLGKYTGQEDIVVGSPIANRHHRQTEGLIGFFVNTQVNRTQLSKGQSYADLVHQVHQEQVEAQLYQDLPFEKLVSELGVERDASRHPIFQVMFGVQSFGDRQKVRGMERDYLRPYELSKGYEVEKFDLSIFINDGGPELCGQVSYATSLFGKETIVRMMGHYVHLLEALTQSPERSYSEISLLSPLEYAQIVHEWNATQRPYREDKTISELFEEQVDRTPSNIALVYEGEQLSYAQLNARSNQLARRIRDKYADRCGRSLEGDTLIALYLNRGIEMVVGILGVLKAGGAYVPIDPGYPQERVGYMLEDTATELVLTQRGLGESKGIVLPAEKVLHIDLSEEIYKEEEETNLAPYSRPTDLAYVIYTSGTTGKPKGVMIEHKGLNNLVYAQKHSFEIDAESKVLQFASLVFDASVSEIFTALISGAGLFIVSDAFRKDSNLLIEYVKHHQINIATLPPILVKTVSKQAVPIFKTLVLAGESCAMDLVHETNLTKKLLNAYGPTEDTICSTLHRYQKGDLSTNIGKPIYNNSVYVLDKNSISSPVGIVGELYIGGAGLARGYLNLPSLTEERFIDNPFASEEGLKKGYTRLYKTGDLVKWLPDGNLQYIGRNDDQVKIRGFRIELGEIEQALLNIAGINQSCVLVKENKTESDSNKYLVGYYQLDAASQRLRETDILQQLSSALPEYMVPGALVQVETFPLTVNGKLDKQALPEPDLSLSSLEYVAPVTQTEVAISKIWQDVLGLDRVGITDNFFKIGGNSILAIHASHRMSKLIGLDVKVSDLFKYSTINELGNLTMTNLNVTEGEDWEILV